ncbi:hypothetical protein [Streptomyces lichenis]|uniref:Uncharacterized protein n=1 Tax=Streptomyces lichenis TaxID=2306967 RepID=A0ABT0I442_9ACTN|nr:hypothetical protein [Streptomyces lichenis]MCK8676096.1 hypothetical protein [Streptomyces lichenis]
MATVVFVHGVGRQYLSEASLARDTVPELLAGIRLAGGPVPEPSEVAVAFYGDLFRPSGTRAGPEPGYDAVDIEGDDEFALLMAWWAEAARTDPDVPAPDEPGTRGPAGYALSRALRLRTVRAALDALTGARRLRGVLDRTLIGDLKQVTAYFRDEDVRIVRDPGSYFTGRANALTRLQAGPRWLLRCLGQRPATRPWTPWSPGWRPPPTRRPCCARSPPARAPFLIVVDSLDGAGPADDAPRPGGSPGSCCDRWAEWSASGWSSAPAGSCCRTSANGSPPWTWTARRTRTTPAPPSTSAGCWPTRPPRTSVAPPRPRSSPPRWPAAPAAASWWPG